ncbi:unnamed protein product [Allacma fusca]|uniref:Uncharacterized protein n=1 Tax=Allacma fusca TaxID=39272 RepID=A0A8J2LB48_9HEXA|nr:unnamed protein product [Allacma fusca]
MRESKFADSYLAYKLFADEKALVLKVMSQFVYPAGELSASEDVSTCNNVALVDFRSKILHIGVPNFRRRTVQSKPFLIGKESLFSGLWGWDSTNKIGNKLFGFLRNVLESGIFLRVRARIERLDRTKYDLKYLQSLPRAVEALKIRSNFIQTLFLIYLLLFAICTGIFFVEIISTVKCWRFEDTRKPRVDRRGVIRGTQTID